ncbi:MAG: pilus assembly protein TadG-related protein [Pirellulales bacterium]
MFVRLSSRVLRRRRGKALIFLLICLPALIGVLGLAVDGGFLLTQQRNLQHATDAAATAAAMDLRLGKPDAVARETARAYVQNHNGFAGANVTIAIPPTSGVNAGNSGFVQVDAALPYSSFFMQAAGGEASTPTDVRSCAGCVISTAATAVHVLDENPPAISVLPVGVVLPSFPALIGGLEVLGLGSVKVDGAVLVNTRWGGKDEHGELVGANMLPPYGVSCTPLLGLTRLKARDVRTAGGVDQPNSYAPWSGGSSPLKANRMPVPDPFKSLPVPTKAVDPINVDTTYRGGVSVLTVPIIQPPKVLSPGVYDWIEVVAGAAVFQPGVYIIRGKNPITGLSLNILAGIVSAEGVMFYITNSPAYDGIGGGPDAGDGEIRPTPPAVLGMLPSVLINAALPGSRFSPIQTSGSPFKDVLIYQRRHDYRPIAIVHQGLLGTAEFSGTLYAKWGHVLMVGNGDYELSIAAGTARLVTVLGMTITPSNSLPAAKDVYLTE